MKSAATRLVLILLLALLTSRLGLARAEVGTPVALAGGVLLLAGLFAGQLAQGIGLPRLTGYLIMGIVAGPYVLGFVPAEGVSGLGLVKGLAVSLIALAAGGELHVSLIRRVGLKVVGYCLGVIAAVFAATCVATLAFSPWIAFLQGTTIPQRLAIAALLSSVIASFSPTVTIAIVQETRAKGTFTELLMAFVILGDLIVMVAFSVCAAWVKASLGGGLDLAGLARGIGWELFGSIAVGAAVGFGTFWYLKRVQRDVPIFVAALCFVAAEMGVRLHLSPLLLSIAAGAVVANLRGPEGKRLSEAIHKVGLPVFALFFAVAGAGLQLDALAKVGLLGIALVGVRGAALFVSSRVLAPREPVTLGRFLWLGLVSQAGVTFGLASLVARTFPTFGGALETLVIGMVTVHELVGPILVRRALAGANEIGEHAGRQKV